MGHNYNKIQAPYRRLNGSKTISIGDPVDEYVDMLHGIRWIGTEKIDGTNCNIFYDGNDVSYVGHTEKTVWNPEVAKWLEDNFVNNEAFVQMCEQNFGDKVVIFHGELVGPKIQSNLYNLKDYKFILFDMKINLSILNRKDMEEVANIFNLELAHVCVTGTLEDCCRYVIERNHFSQVYDKREIEGVVIRPESELFKRNGERIIYKVKIKDLLGVAPITLK